LLRKLFRKNYKQNKYRPAAGKKLTPLERQWPFVISSHVVISENSELMEELICSRERALHTQKSPYEIERETDFHGRPFGALRSTIFG